MSSLESISTSTSLIDRVRERDAEAWRRFARLYAPLVYRWARQCKLQSSDAADVVQEVFATVAENIDRFRHDQPHSSLRGWLWTITRNLVRLHYRRRKDRPDATGGSAANHVLQQLPGDDVDWCDPNDLVIEPDSRESRVELVHRAVHVIRHDFQPQTWQAFWKMVVEGRSASEVGEQLGMTAAAVRQAKYRVLCRLQDELKDS